MKISTKEKIVYLIIGVIITVIAIITICSLPQTGENDTPADTTAATVTTYTPVNEDDVSQMRDEINQVINGSISGENMGNTSQKRSPTTAEFKLLKEQIIQYMKIRDWNSILLLTIKTKQDYNIIDPEQIRYLASLSTIATMSTDQCADKRTLFDAMDGLEEKMLIYTALSNDIQAMMLSDLNVPALPENINVKNIVIEDCSCSDAGAIAYYGGNTENIKFTRITITYTDEINYEIYWAQPENDSGRITNIVKLKDSNPSTYTDYFEMNHIEFAVCNY